MVGCVGVDSTCIDTSELGLHSPAHPRLHNARSSLAAQPGDVVLLSTFTDNSTARPHTNRLAGPGQLAGLLAEFSACLGRNEPIPHIASDAKC